MAGTFARILSIPLVGSFIASPVVHAMSVLGRQDLYLRLNLMRAACVLAVFGSAYVFDWGAPSTIVGYSIALTACYILVLWQVLSLLSPPR
jgi:hypothetical protein